MHDVVIVGAGPVGTLLAGELARRDVDVALLERRTGRRDGSRAIGVHAPVLAALERSGVTERLLDQAKRVVVGEARSAGELVGTVRFDRLSRRFPFVATLPQPWTERALALHAPAPRAATAVAVSAERDHARVRTEEGDEVVGRIVVNAGGPRARGLVYRAVPARSYPDRFVMADVVAPGTDVAIVHLDARGVLESFPLPGGRRRFVAPAPPGAPDDADASGAILRDALAARGEREAAASVDTASWFAIRRVVAPRMRRDRVFAIGDAAHEISPMGGQGMNLGLLDAATLAPLLTTWLRTGVAPDAALRAWERRRVRSARRAAGIATVNTLLGRPAPPLVDAARGEMLRAGLRSPVATLFAHAYAMGLDADA